MEQKLFLGTFTVFVNISAEQQMFINEDKIIDRVSKLIAYRINKLFLNRFPGSSIAVINYKGSRGCILVVISLEAIIQGITAAGLAGATYKFIKDYDKIKKGLKEIINDVNNWSLKIKTRIFTVKPANINATESEIEIIADSEKPFAESSTIFLSEEETITIHKLTIMRDDFVEEIETIKSEKNIRRTRPKK
ncbi:MAG TPA: hypothetical protein VL092_08955 [Chitinophagaceae bacterium]|nr:hypothetical protein [Chitinophagaceae bacterium]